MSELYAIVGTLERARFMLDAGVPYLQLRFKERPLAPHREEIAGWPRRYPRTRLIINDDLAFAIAVGAWGAHLGQEDAMRYAPAELRRAPLKLGISTHDDAERARALEWGAALIGFGPVYPTATKDVRHAPQGVERLREAVRTSLVPVIAIGGITPANLALVVAAGPAMIAMISALEPFQTTQALQELMDAMRG
jgi:thiamine-phosphate pyrophosphorylase